MDAIIGAIDNLIWSRALIALCLGAGLYFSIRTRFMQVRGFKEMLRLTFKGKKSEAGVSSFQALAMSLSGRIGIGNIAGVATAIAVGGPGSIFWMWVMGFLGASTSYIESTLAQIYKTRDADGRYRGGPAYYIEKAVGLKWYAQAFAVATIIATGFLLPGVQANAIADSAANVCAHGWCNGFDGQWLGLPAREAFKLGVGIGVGGLLALIIFGGVRRIAGFAEIIVPFKAGGFILMALIVMLMHIDQVPRMFSIIFASAFGTHAAFGAMFGLAVEWGVKRGIYANEAGQGTGPHAAAAAEVTHPAKQGYVQAFSIYVDTMLVCTATAFLILSTGKYNVYSPDGGAPLYSGVPGVEEGAGYAQAAVESVFPGLGAAFVALALFSFAFTTITAYYYMAETNLTYVNHNRRRPGLILLLRLGIIAMVIYGAFHNARQAWSLGDIGVGLMAWLNVVAILILQKPALIALKDYEAQKKAGHREPVFDAEAAGVRNTSLWKREP
ncbi:MAG: alanine/glycine:cation symporter family protein [Solimonas sp.]